MLKQTTQNVPYIGIFKTATGEEFIGRVVEETMLQYRIEQPLCMVPTQQGLQFAPFLMMADSDAAINVPKPLITGKPASQLEAQYESATSNIILPQKSAIIS